MKPATLSGHGPGPRAVTSHRFSKLYIDGSGWKSIHAASGQRLSSKRSRAATRTFSLSGNSTMQHEKAMIADTSASASRSGRFRFAATNSQIGSVTRDAIHGMASHVTRPAPDQAIVLVEPRIGEQRPREYVQRHHELGEEVAHDLRRDDALQAVGPQGVGHRMIAQHLGRHERQAVEDPTMIMIS